MIEESINKVTDELDKIFKENESFSQEYCDLNNINDENINSSKELLNYFINNDEKVLNILNKETNVKNIFHSLENIYKYNDEVNNEILRLKKESIDNNDYTNYDFLNTIIQSEILKYSDIDFEFHNFINKIFDEFFDKKKNKLIDLNFIEIIFKYMGSFKNSFMLGFIKDCENDNIFMDSIFCYNCEDFNFLNYDMCVKTYKDYTKDEFNNLFEETKKKYTSDNYIQEYCDYCKFYKYFTREYRNFFFNTNVKEFNELVEVTEHLIKLYIKNYDENDLKGKNRLILSDSNNLSKLISQFKPELIIKYFIFNNNLSNISELYSYFYVLDEIYSISKCYEYKSKSFLSFLKDVNLLQQNDNINDISIIKDILKKILKFSMQLNINDIISFNFIKILFPMSILKLFSPFFEIKNYYEEDIELINFNYIKENTKINYLKINIKILDLILEVLDDLRNLSIFNLELKINGKTLNDKYEEFLNICNDNYNFLKDKLNYLNEFYFTKK